MLSHAIWGLFWSILIQNFIKNTVDQNLDPPLDPPLMTHLHALLISMELNFLLQVASDIKRILWTFLELKTFQFRRNKNVTQITFIISLFAKRVCTDASRRNQL